MNNDRRKSDARLLSLETICKDLIKDIKDNKRSIEEQNKKIDVLITKSDGVINAFNDAQTWIKVTKWGMGVVGLVSVAWYWGIKVFKDV